MNKAYLYPMRLLYPPRCTFCQEILHLTVDNLLCFECKTAYPLIDDPSCYQCGKQLIQDDELCLDCKSTRHLYEKGIALYPYEGSVREALYRFKYGGRRKYAQFFAHNMHQKLRETSFWGKIDLIVPVPVSQERLKQRGYNQAQELARHLSKISGLPWSGDTLIRTRDTRPQSEFTQEQRYTNIKDAFRCKTKLPPKYKVILIIDDIYTTGSTINECTKVLKQSGVQQVYSCVICTGILKS